jgi:hypothetical protein
MGLDSWYFFSFISYNSNNSSLRFWDFYIKRSSMVVEINGYWICEECKLKYGDKIWAEKCEAWCKKYKSCNLEITKHSIK